MTTQNRRRFIAQSTAAAAGVSSVLGTHSTNSLLLPSVRAEDVKLDANRVHFREDIEPLVRI